ncbi:hypothetical protein BDQ17DRAFT_1245790 [Cyathus striatus]|nr:hypothetical protein BDQ17DRAFT_1245790 [Cyathus striatus]
MQVNVLDSSRRLHEDTRQYPTEEGIVYPDDRHFIFSSETTTVAQFRSQDYGMERCTLTINLTDYLFSQRPLSVDVWELDSSTEISRYIPSAWATAPQRRKIFGTFEADDNSELPWISNEFSCPSGSLMTFEFGCSSKIPECQIDFWQHRSSQSGMSYT